MIHVCKLASTCERLQDVSVHDSDQRVASLIATTIRRCDKGQIPCRLAFARNRHKFIKSYFRKAAQAVSAPESGSELWQQHCHCDPIGFSSGVSERHYTWRSGAKKSGSCCDRPNSSGRAAAQLDRLEVRLRWPTPLPWFAPVETLQGQQDLAGLSPKCGFIAAQSIKRRVGQIGQLQKRLCDSVRLVVEAKVIR